LSFVFPFLFPNLGKGLEEKERKKVEFKDKTFCYVTSVERMIIIECGTLGDYVVVVVVVVVVLEGGVKEIFGS